jgi:hypothetical protein
MPNFRLTEAEVKDVLEFIQKQTEVHMGGAKGEFSAAPAAEPDPASATKAKPSCPGCVKHKVAVASSEPSAPKSWKPDRGGVPPLKESK